MCALLASFAWKRIFALSEADASKRYMVAGDEKEDEGDLGELLSICVDGISRPHFPSRILSCFLLFSTLFRPYTSHQFIIHVVSTLVVPAALFFPAGPAPDAIRVLIIATNGCHIELLSNFG